MDIQELKPIIDLMNTQEERLANKINKQEERLVNKINDVHDDVKRINSTVGDHDRYISNSKAIWKFIIGGIGLVATIIGIWYIITG